MRTRAATVAALGAALVGVAGCGGSSGGGPTGEAVAVGGSASCAGPTVTVEPGAARPGDTVRAHGEWFAADCYDTGQQGTPPPLTGMTVKVSQDGTSWRVATGVDATGDHYAFDVPVVLPSELHGGDAVVRVEGYGLPATVHVQGT